MYCFKHLKLIFVKLYACPKVVDVPTYVNAAVCEKCRLLVLQTEKILWLVTKGSCAGSKNKDALAGKSLSSRYLKVAFIFTSAHYLEKSA